MKRLLLTLTFFSLLVSVGEVFAQEVDTCTTPVVIKSFDPDGVVFQHRLGKGEHLWEFFGDEVTPSESEEASPVVSFPRPGKYALRLTPEKDLDAIIFGEKPLPDAKCLYLTPFVERPVITQKKTLAGDIFTLPLNIVDPDEKVEKVFLIVREDGEEVKHWEIPRTQKEVSVVASELPNPEQTHNYSFVLELENAAGDLVDRVESEEVFFVKSQPISQQETFLEADLSVSPGNNVGLEPNGKKKVIFYAVVDNPGAHALGFYEWKVRDTDGTEFVHRIENPSNTSADVFAYTFEKGPGAYEVSFTVNNHEKSFVAQQKGIIYAPFAHKSLDLSIQTDPSDGVGFVGDSFLLQSVLEGNYDFASPRSHHWVIQRVKLDEDNRILRELSGARTFTGQTVDFSTQFAGVYEVNLTTSFTDGTRQRRSLEARTNMCVFDLNALFVEDDFSFEQSECARYQQAQQNDDQRSSVLEQSSAELPDDLLEQEEDGEADVITFETQRGPVKALLPNEAVTFFLQGPSSGGTIEWRFLTEDKVRKKLTTQSMELEVAAGFPEKFLNQKIILEAEEADVVWRTSFFVLSEQQMKAFQQAQVSEADPSHTPEQSLPPRIDDVLVERQGEEVVLEIAVPDPRASFRYEVEVWEKKENDSQRLGESVFQTPSIVFSQEDVLFDGPKTKREFYFSLRIRDEDAKTFSSRVKSDVFLIDKTQAKPGGVQQTSALTSEQEQALERLQSRTSLDPAADLALLQTSPEETEKEQVGDDRLNDPDYIPTPEDIRNAQTPEERALLFRKRLGGLKSETKTQILEQSSGVRKDGVVDEETRSSGVQDQEPENESEVPDGEEEISEQGAEDKIASQVQDEPSEVEDQPVASYDYIELSERRKQGFFTRLWSALKGFFGW